jgi:hypothetical protein
MWMALERLQNVLHTDKQKVFAVWNYAEPKCFKHVKTMLCSYKNNSNAWITLDSNNIAYHFEVRS